MSDFFLPEALMMNIWLRLPIKSTVRFRCVSKSWCSFLSDPQFIYKNLTFLGAENERDLLLVLDSNQQFYSVFSHETLVATPVTVLSPLQVSPLRGVPSTDQFHRDVITYSCDDLVCFHNENGTAVGVWNLTTGETKMLPPVSDEYFRFTALGFGFDDKIQDYKIVQIRRSDCYRVYVYSLYSGNNCWRKLDETNVPECELLNPYIAFWRSVSFRDGIFYWCDSADVIVSFDMSSEVFNTISIPRHLRSIERICKLKRGSMFLISHTYDDEDNEEYGLWAWLEVGVTPSLTKLFCIDWHNADFLESLGFWRNELVFDSSKGLRISDPTSKRESKVIEYDEPIYGIRCCLVWTKGKNSVPLN